MKSSVIILLLFCFYEAPFAQRVPSSCDAPDSIKKYYRDDIAIQVIFNENRIYSPYLDSIFLPERDKDYFSRIIFAVYNAIELPARDTILRYNIHDYSDCILHNILFTFDTTIAWGKRFSQRFFPTGNQPFDSLLEKYNISIDSIWFNQPYGGSSILHTSEPLNLFPLMKILDRIAKPRLQSQLQIDSADGELLNADVNKDSTVSINFSFGWEQCPSYCRFRRFWNFTVFPDCSVRYDGATGDPLPQDGVLFEKQSNFNMIIYPNPASGKIIVTSLPQSIIEMIDVSGNVCKKIRSTEDETEIDISSLTSGAYFIVSTGKDGNRISKKFIKE